MASKRKRIRPPIENDEKSRDELATVKLLLIAAVTEMVTRLIELTILICDKR